VGEVWAREWGEAYDTEDSITFSAILDRLVNDIVFHCHLLLPCILQVHDAILNPTQVNLRQSFVEEDLGKNNLNFRPSCS
jgi:hypothetical protein